jgi:hypothetical protein
VGVHYLAKDRANKQVPVNAVMNLGVSRSVGNFLTSLGITGFCRRTRLHGVSQMRIKDTKRKEPTVCSPVMDIYDQGRRVGIS